MTNTRSMSRLLCPRGREPCRPLEADGPVALERAHGLGEDVDEFLALAVVVTDGSPAGEELGRVPCVPSLDLLGRDLAAGHVAESGPLQHFVDAVGVRQRQRAVVADGEWSSGGSASRTFPMSFSVIGTSDRNASRPPSRSARRMLPNAATGSAKNMIPNRLTAASNAASGNGYTCASPWWNATFSTPSRSARSR